AVSGVVGVAGGLVAARVIRATNERTIQLGVSIVAAYGTYQLADVIGLSGILATVIAGITLGSRMRRRAGADALVREIEDLWDVVAFILTSLVFLLIGFAVRLPSLLGAGAAVAIGTGAVVVGRAVMVYVPALALRLWTRPLPHGWVHVIFWSGLRGAIAHGAPSRAPRAKGTPRRPHARDRLGRTARRPHRAQSEGHRRHAGAGRAIHARGRGGRGEGLPGGRRRRGAPHRHRDLPRKE